MKYLKKSAALLLALIMILALSAPALAVGNSSTDTPFTITISNPAVGDTYSAYKIFDVTYTLTCTTDHTHNDTCYNFSYTIGSDSPWFSVITSGVTESSDAFDCTTYHLKLTKSPGTEKTGTDNNTYYTYNVEINPDGSGNTFSAANFAAAMSAEVTKSENAGKFTAAASSSQVTAKDDGTVDPVTLTVTDTGGPGYYLVTCSGASPAHTNNPALAELTTTNPTVTIQDKNSVPFEKTVDDNNGVEIGQLVTYTIKGEVPSTSGYTSYTYKVSDKMSQGLTFDLDSVVIKVGTGTDNTKYDKNSTSSDWTVTGFYGYWDDTTGAWVTTYTDKDGKVQNYKENDKYGTNNENTVILIGFTADVDFTRTGAVGADNKKANVPGSNLYTVGDKIEITYSATVNDQAVSVVSQNEATLTYSNDPDTPITTTTEAEVYSSKIVINKYEDGYTQATITGSAFEQGKTYYTYDETSKEYTKATEPNPDTNKPYYLSNSEVATKALANAEFMLYKTVTTGEGEAATTTTYYYRAYRAATGDEIDKQLIARIDTNTTATIVDVDWTAEKANATAFVTDTNGAATIPGLEDGTYYLLETKAPDGYNLLKDPVSVTVDGSGDKNEDGTVKKDAEGNIIRTLTVNADVANNAGSLLPSTGGMGTTIFYIVGAILVLGAAVLLITRRRMNADK